jgi:hypothetical protein
VCCDKISADPSSFIAFADSIPPHSLPRVSKYRTVLIRDRDSSVGITTGYGFGGRDSIPGKGKILFSTRQNPHWLYVPPRLVSNVYWGGAFERVKRPGLEADHHLQLVPTLIVVEIYLHHPHLFIESCLINHNIRTTFCFTFTIELIHRVDVRYRTIKSVMV